MGRKCTGGTKPGFIDGGTHGEQSQKKVKKGNEVQQYKPSGKDAEGGGAAKGEESGNLDPGDRGENGTGNCPTTEQREPRGRRKDLRGRSKGGMKICPE